MTEVTSLRTPIFMNIVIVSIRDDDYVYKQAVKRL